MKKKVMAGVSVLLLAIIGGAVWAFSQREDPEVAKAKEDTKKIMENFNNEDATAAERVQMIQETRKVTENLSDEQRREVRREGMNSMKERMTERINEYLAIEDEKERVAFLDREIDRWEEMGNEFRKARKEREEKEGENGEAKGDRGRRGGWGGPPTPGDREGNLERSRRRLDSSTPEQRAMFTEYFGAIMKRREERGMSNSWGR